MKNKLTVFALLMLFITSMSFAQYPSGISGVNPQGSYVVPAALGGVPLSNGTAYDFYLLDGSDAIVGNKVDFTYINAGGNLITWAQLGSPVLNANTQYRWGVWLDGAPVPTAGTVVYGRFTFTTNSAAPAYTTPANGAAGLSSVGLTLNWGAAAGATHYQVTVRNSVTLVAVAGFPQTVAAPTQTVTLPALTLGASYEWSVASSNDGGTNFSSTAFWSFTVSATNLSPVLAAIEAPPALEYMEGTPAAITGSITVSDPDDTNIESATVQITTNYQLGSDILSYTNVAPIAGVWNAGTGTMTLTGSATLAEYQTALRSVMFSSSEMNSTRVVTFRVNDGDNNSNTQTRNINVTPFLVSIVNGLTGVTIEPTFIWHDKPAETSYELRISTAGANQGAFDAAVIFTDLAIPANTVTVSYNELSANDGAGDPLPFPLTNGTTYYWQLTAKGAPDFVSVIRHFTTYPDLTVTLYNPENSGTNYQGSTAMFSYGTGTSTTGLEFKIQWYQLDAGLPTEAQWAATTTPGNALSGYMVTTNLSYNKTGLYEGKRYCWRVIVQRSSNQEILDYSAVQTFTNTGGSSVVVNQSYPVGGETVYTQTPTAYWYLDHYATGLTYQVAYRTTAPGVGNTNLFDDGGAVTIAPLPDPPSLVNQYYTFPTLPYATTIWWQVRAYYPANLSSTYSAIQSFVTPAAVSTAPIQPVLSYPITGVTVYTTAPTLNWYLGVAANTGLRYQVAIKDNVAPVDGDLFDGEALTILSPAAPGNYVNCIEPLFKDLSGLIPGHTYYWQVRSKYSDIGGWSTPSTIESFVIVGASTDRFALVTWPVDNATVYSTRPKLSWYLEGFNLGVGGYTVKYSSANQHGNWRNYAPGAASATGGVYTVGSTVFSQTLDVDLTAGTQYYWAVAVSNDASSETAYSEGSFTVIGGAAIELSWPTDGAQLSSTSVSLSWFVVGPTSDIDHYSIIYSNSDVFAGSAPITQTTTSLNMTKNLTGLNQGSSYWWKVRGWKDAGGTVPATNWSSTYRFDIAAGSLRIVVQPLVGGPDKLTVNTNSPVLSWMLPSKTAANSQYEVQIADNSNFSNAKLVTSNSESATVKGLPQSSAYYWRVRAKDTEGKYSNYSNTGKFGISSSITGVKNEEELPTEFSLAQNYPNPFNPTTIINYSLPINSFVTLRVFDMLGREVKTLVSSNVVAGRHAVEWKGDDNFGNKVTTGVYVYRISADNFVSSKKMLLIK